MATAPPVVKDPVILDTVSRLRTRFGDEAFDVIDHWLADPGAVGLASYWDRRVLAYVAAYEGGYFVELEVPPGPGDSFPYQVAAEYTGVSFDQLVDLLRNHFKLS